MHPVRWVVASSYRLWAAFILAHAVGFGVVHFALPAAFRAAHLRLELFGAVATMLATGLAAAPLFRFLAQGWSVRYAEILAALPGPQLAAYLDHFWPASAQARAARGNEAAFRELYHDQYGRGAFLTPIFLLLAVLFVESVLTTLRWRGVLAFPDDTNAGIALAAIGGTYMFVVGDTVASVRSRGLNIADVYWYALRALLAVPIGIAAIGLAPANTGTFVAFGLGTVPVDELVKLLRRLTLGKITGQEQKGDDDQLITLEGVTVGVSSRLAAEGVTSIDQLACMDPVLLAIRTGLPLQLIMRIASQAVVQGHLGAAIAKLVPIGLNDVRAVKALLDNRAAATSVAALNDACTRLHTTDAPAAPTPDSLLFVFERIVADPRTAFLL